ncbi:MAG: hypothetical protein NC043_08835 [Muribaculaceae bacterium]|nr:hypothetical protein [Muribaculaceae bacterium]
MRKSLLAIVALSAFFCAGAQTAPYAEWGYLMDGGTSAGDQGTGVAVNKSGDVYWYGTLGSTESALSLNYAGEFLFDGAPYNAGTSYGNNITILKTDPNGKKLWAVYSNSGDYASNVGGIAATSDGGVVVAAYVRHTDGMTDKNLNLFQANGTEYVIDWTCEKRYYRLMLTKISSDGQVEWLHLYDISTNPGPKASGNYASFWSDCMKIGEVKVDENDNIYLAINYRNEFRVPKTDGSDMTFTPSNIATWTGDSQTAAGDFLLLGLDKNGYYRNSLTLDGTATAAYCQKLVWDNGKIYAQGYITGNGSENTISNIALKPTNGVMSPMLVCADANLNVSWAKCFPGEKVQNKMGFQNVGLSKVNENLYFVGMYNLKFSDPDNAENFVASTQGNLREGFVVKIDAANGDWLGARDSRDDEFCQGGATAKTGLTGYMDVIANPEKDDMIYVIGYVLNANVGVFMRGYNSKTLEADLAQEYNLVTKGGSPSYMANAYDHDNGFLYLAARGNNVFSLRGISEDTAKPVAWGVLCTKVKLPDALKFAAIEGVMASDYDENAPVEYYNLQGIRVSNPTSGIYIRRQGSKSTKVIL